MHFFAENVEYFIEVELNIIRDAAMVARAQACRSKGALQRASPSTRAPKSPLELPSKKVTHPQN